MVRLIRGSLLLALILAACGPTSLQAPTDQPSPPTEPSPTIPSPTTEPPTPESPSESPSLIFHNGRVVTMDSAMRTLEALAVLDDIIVAMGSNQEILALAGPSTEMVDLEGHALLPGFVDAHTHILNDAEAHLNLTLQQAQDLALENGITTLANMYVEEWFLEELRALEAQGNLRVRTSAYLVATNNCGEPAGDWYTAYPPTDRFGEMLRIGGVKLFTDGGTCGNPAVTDETHPGAGQGDLFMSAEALGELVTTADKGGYQVAIHALGDRAIDQAIDALNAAIEIPGNPERHRLEHSFYMVDGQFGRFSVMGVHPVIFGYWPTCEVDGTGRTDNWKTTIRRWRELVDANPGLIIAAKTDTPWLGPPSPLLELYSLTTLKEVAPDGSICEPPAWIRDRTLTIEEALPMVTANAAYLLFREDEVGSLEPQKLADLIILSESPLDVNADDLKDIEVWMTMVGGETAFCAQGQDRFCPR